MEFQWIEGHQDDNKGDHGFLDWWARQNINMDRAAKQHWKDTKQSTPPNLPFKHEQWAMSIQGQKLSSFDKDLVYERVASADVIKYWKEKKSNPIEDEVFDSMNWPASKVAIKERPQGKQRFFYKFATGNFACGRQMLNRGEWPHDKWPRCGEVAENNVRIIKCQAPSAVAVRSKAFDSLQEMMVDAKTHPIIMKHIMDSLTAWVNDDPLPQPTGSNELRLALQGQNNIGPFNMILGRIHSDLEVRQDKYYRSKNLKRSGRRWTIELIKKLQDVAWDMWDHRNSVLHNNPTRHFQADEAKKAAQDIEKEWKRGVAGLLKQDHFLFRSRKTVDERSLEKKWEWLRAVKLARAAAAEVAKKTDSYEPERQGLRNFLERHQQQQSNKRARRAPRDNTTSRNKKQTTHNTTCATSAPGGRPDQGKPKED